MTVLASLVDSPVDGQSGRLLELEDVDLVFRRGRQRVQALAGVSLTLEEGAALGLVGESGSGKTSLGRVITRLVKPDSGRVLFDGQDVLALDRAGLLAYRREVQTVFQNSAVAYNPRRTVLGLLSDGYAIHGIVPRRERRAQAAEALAQVGLPADFLDRYPHQLSGGQRQRLGLARALTTDPRLLVADEPVSALDMSVQAQVLNLIAELRESHRLTLLMISHDLRAVYFLCERIAVLYLGRIVEIASRADIFERPLHPYTGALVAAVPAFRPGAGFSRKPLAGEAGDRQAADHSCAFAPRCSLRAALGGPSECVERRPQLRPVGDGSVACHFAESQLGRPAVDSELPVLRSVHRGER